jgi:hypothetical protein
MKLTPSTTDDLIARGAAIAAYSLAVMLVTVAIDAAHGDGAAAELAGAMSIFLLIFALVPLQIVAGYALGWWAFLVLALPLAGAWWVDRGYEQGAYDYVTVLGLAIMYVVQFGLLLTALGVALKYWRHRPNPRRRA